MNFLSLFLRMPAPGQGTASKLAAACRARLASCCASLLLVVGQATCAQQINFERFGQSEGLTNLVARCLLQDSAGFVWVCTENGLFRFDGRRFERFAADQGIVDPDIRAAGIGSDGRLWIGTPSDLLVMTGQRFEPVRPGGRVLAVTKPVNQIQVLSPNEVLFTERQQLLRLHRVAASSEWSVTPVFSAELIADQPELGKISMVHVVGPGGSVWLGCDQQLCEMRDGQITVWGSSRGVPPTLWRTVIRDRAGRLWARGVAGVVVLEPGSLAFERRDPPQAVLSGAPNYAPLIEDAVGHILTRTDTGLARWDGERWHRYDTSNGLLPTPITALLADGDGEVWTGSAGRGLARWLGYGVWETWTAAQGLDNEAIWGMVKTPTGNLLIATGKGCRLLKAGATRIGSCAIKGLPNEEIFTLESGPHGTAFAVVSSKRLFWIDAQAQHAREIAKLPRTLDLKVTSSDLWVATEDGMNLFDLASGSHRAEWHPRKPKDLKVATKGPAVGPDKNLWFASDEGLLLGRPDGAWSTVAVEHVSGRVACDDLSFAPDGALWVSTPRGVARLQLEGERVVQTEWMSSPLLRDLNVMFMRFDARGWLWVGSDQGLVLFDGTTWRRLEPSDGLVWNDLNKDAFYSDPDGSLWFGTSGGLSRLLAPERLRGAQRLSVKIVSARYGDQAIDAPAGGQAAVPWRSDASLDMSMAVLGPALSRGTLLRYRIPSLSDEWFESPNEQFHVPSLGPGRYQLEVTAVRPNSALAAPVTTLSFELRAPWWRTGWFKALAALLLALVVVLAWRRRTRSLKTRQAHLERLLERATRDPLTGLWNRATILDMLSTAIERARADGTTLAIAIIDIDHFKRINDELGHLAGDEVLRSLGRQLAANVRKGDVLGRYGGEELLLLMPGLPALTPSNRVEDLRQLIAQADIRFEGKRIHVTASLGVDWLGPTTSDANSLIGRADAALYAAKNSGRNRVAYAGENPELADASATV